MEEYAGSDVNQDQLALLETRLRLQNQLKRGANWFFWIAALSLINSIIWIVGGEWNFIIGLGVTQVIDVIASIVAESAGADLELVFKAVALFLDIGVLAAFVVFGIFARRGNKWFFVTGMVLYGLDALIFLLVQDWLSIGFHAFALWGLSGGVRAIGKLKELEQTQVLVA